MLQWCSLWCSLWCLLWWRWRSSFLYHARLFFLKISLNPSHNSKIFPLHEESSISSVLYLLRDICNIWDIRRSTISLLLCISPAILRELNILSHLRQQSPNRLLQEHSKQINSKVSLSRRVIYLLLEKLAMMFSCHLQRWSRKSR